MSLINSSGKSIQKISQFLNNKVQKRDFFQKIRVFKNPIYCLGIAILCLALFSKYTSVKEDISFLPPRFKASQNTFFNQEKVAFWEIPESVVIEENSFKEAVPVTIFKGSVLGILTSGVPERREIIEYVIGDGDSLSQIAQKFDISLETILWANDLNSRSKIQPGQKLVILPVSGAMYLVEKGETVSEIAEAYKADVLEIISFNELSEEAEVFAGDILVIPGGVKPPKPTIQYAPLASSYLICPIPSPCSITQGLHWYNAIDFSNGKCGESVFSAAGGTVQKTGYHSVAGRYVRVLHPNNVVTFYGHLSSISVVPGQKVSQGETIGYVGNTGYTIGATGCHVHFEVRGARNPFR